MEKRKLSSNVWKLYFIKGLRSFMMAIPIIVLFFQENGLSMKQVFILQALFSLAVITLEVPTGYFSDIFGRKISILFGGILATAGFAIYSQAYGFWGFLLAEITLGFGLSFVSGADSAMLYDTLLEIGRADEYKKAEGKTLGVGLISESIASIVGGFMATISLRYPLYFDVLTTAFIIPVALTLVEPRRSRLKSEEKKLRQIFRLIKFALNDHKEIKWLILYSSLSAASTLVMFWFMQPYLLANKVPLNFFGIILAGFLLIGAGFSWNAHKIEKKFGKKKSLVILIILPVLSYFLVSSFWFSWSIFLIAPMYLSRGINNPVILDYINGSISSENRATILSIKNFVGRLFFVVLGPIFGWLNDVFSLRTALLSAGMTFLILGIITLVFMRKHKIL